MSETPSFASLRRNPPKTDIIFERDSVKSENENQESDLTAIGTLIAHANQHAGTTSSRPARKRVNDHTYYNSPKGRANRLRKQNAIVAQRNGIRLDQLGEWATVSIQDMAVLLAALEYAEN